MRRSRDSVWKGHAFVWKRPPGWVGVLKAWLGPRFGPAGIEALRPGLERDLCWDDTAWLDLLETALAVDLEDAVDELADDLRHAVLRTYHGTRTIDAGIFHREGLKVHDRRAMTERLRHLVDAHDELATLRGDALARAIAEVDNRTDDGRLHVVADDQFLLDHAAHYLIYGSEWVAAVLGEGNRRFLRTQGAPTLLEIDLPLRMAGPRSRQEFAKAMLREWARLTCNEADWSAPIDFAFCLHVDIPPACVVGHTHPTEFRDPLDRRAIYVSDVTTCMGCGG
ncbi:hypothetical protein MKK63_25255 [Methylobacterium sp. J-088]|uniref:hypothetical protein n=1 Tax=Methylobacterium sp. J-088 TaxID=2836664 RepID=UPI001FB892C5|nr:hypothetical protein [Methylobacterium sp. J-088]MCJ2065989.1 hypothetical protein [Methylobacterium sp. J-088]